MRTALLISRRNLRVHFRDHAATFFSFLAALILFALYVLFLGNLQVENLEERLPNAASADIQWFVSAWVLAGIVMITTVTTGLAGLGTFVDDRASGRYRDFLVSPIKRWQLIVGYMISAQGIAIVLGLLVLTIGLVYFAIRGYPLPSPVTMLEAVGLVVLLSASFAALSAFAATFVKSAAAFTSLSTIVGTLIGFLAGGYIPPGALPDRVVEGLNVLPFAQAAMLVRHPLVLDAANTLTSGDAKAMDQLGAYYGLDLYVGGSQISLLSAVLVLVAILLIFTILASRRIRTIFR